MFVDNKTAIRGNLSLVFNATFNNISAILWSSVLLVEETGGPGKNHRVVASQWQTLSHNGVSSAIRGKYLYKVHKNVLYYMYIEIKYL